MDKKILNRSWAIIMPVLLFSACKRDHFPCDCKEGGVPTVKVFATGLNSPRGLRFGPDGNLYVAEAGLGGTDSTIGICEQVVFPVGPYKGSATGGRISKIDHWGSRTTVTDQLPSSGANEIIGGDKEGVADVEFIGHDMYALVGGGGCSHGVSSKPNGVYKINNDGSSSLLANLSDWLMAHPVQNPEEEDFEPDGTFYSMINVHNDLYVLEPNHGDFIKVSKNGAVDRVADISATQGHIVPTVSTYHGGNFIVGNLSPFPVTPGSSNLYEITPSGDVSVMLTGFTTILGLTTDEFGRLYVLENSTAAGQGPTPNTGDIIRIGNSGERETLVSNLSLPTGLTFGPDHKLYVSVNGFGPEANGGGQVLQIDLQHCVPATDDNNEKN